MAASHRFSKGLAEITMSGDKGLYQGLLGAIGNRSLPADLKNCIAGDPFSPANSESFRSLIDRRDSHIARLYQHERDLTARVYELEGKIALNSIKSISAWGKTSSGLNMLMPFLQKTWTLPRMTENWLSHGSICGYLIKLRTG